MTVKELISLLLECDPNSVVYVEANCVPNARIVQEYYSPSTNEKFVYIADETDWIDDHFVDAVKIQREANYEI